MLHAEKALEHKVGDSETDFLITLDLDVLYPKMARLLGKTRLKRLIVGSLGDFSGQPDAVRAGLKQAGQLADVAHDERHLTFSALLDNDGEPVRHPFGDPVETLAVLQYTGGTTGAPKGAMLTHASIMAACSTFCETVRGEQRWSTSAPSGCCRCCRCSTSTRC